MLFFINQDDDDDDDIGDVVNDDDDDDVTSQVALAGKPFCFTNQKEFYMEHYTRTRNTVLHCVTQCYTVLLCYCVTLFYTVLLCVTLC